MTTLLDAPGGGGFANKVATILPGSITTADLADGAVTSIKIANNLQSDNWNGTTVAAQDATEGWRIERNTGNLGINSLYSRGELRLFDTDATGADVVLNNSGVILPAYNSLAIPSIELQRASIEWFKTIGGVDEDERNAWVRGLDDGYALEIANDGDGAGNFVQMVAYDTVAGEFARLTTWRDLTDNSRISAAIDSVTVLDMGVNYAEFGVQTLLPSGNVGAPALAFTGDADTGLYRPAANQLSLVSNGATAVRIDGSQNVDLEDHILYDVRQVRTNLNLASGNIGYTFGQSLNTGVALNTADGDTLALVAGGNSITLDPNRDLGAVRILTVNEIHADDGASGDPSYTFASDQTTGMYLSGTSLAISSGGAASAVWNAAGNLSLQDHILFDVEEARVNDGTVGNPSFTFNDDGDTGFYRYGTNNIGAATGAGVSTVFIAAGIAVPNHGTTGSAANAHIASGGSPAGILRRSTSSAKFKRNIRDWSPRESDWQQIRPVVWESDIPGEKGKVFRGFVYEELPGVFQADEHEDLRAIVAALVTRVRELERAAA